MEVLNGILRTPKEHDEWLLFVAEADSELEPLIQHGGSKMYHPPRGRQVHEWRRLIRNYPSAVLHWMAEAPVKTDLLRWCWDREDEHIKRERPVHRERGALESISAIMSRLAFHEEREQS